jgi:hypothetical protein
MKSLVWVVTGFIKNLQLVTTITVVRFTTEKEKG